MRNPAVHWHEGMFLRPQHFQAAERNLREFVSTGQLWSCHYNYGIRSLEISSEALANSQLQVTACRARLPDGTLLVFEAGQELERVDLKTALDTKTTVRAVIGVPKMRLGLPNVGTPMDVVERRYVRHPWPLPDESQGANDQEIEIRRERVRVLNASSDLAGYDVLPLVQIRRAAGEDGAPEIDDDYFPPCLAIDGWPPLKQLVRETYDILGNKIGVLSTRVRERGITATTPKDFEDVLILTAIHQAQAYLHCLTFAQGVHPFLAYSELCRIVGALAVLRPERHLPASTIPPYDHDDLARIFRWAKSMIIELLRPGEVQAYEQRPFVGMARGMEVAIDEKWLLGWEWYVGVNAVNISDETCRELLRKGSGKVDWVIASRSKVDSYFDLKLPGIELQEMRAVPSELPANRGWIYYRIGRDSNAWKDVYHEKMLGLRVSREFLADEERLPGSTQLELKNLGDKRVVLEFAIFAVPKGAGVASGPGDQS